MDSPLIVFVVVVVVAVDFAFAAGFDCALECIEKPQLHSICSLFV